MRRLLTVLSDNDPGGRHCMSDPNIGHKEWMFEFDQVEFSISAFAPFYPNRHPRCSCDREETFIVLQPTSDNGELCRSYCDIPMAWDIVKPLDDNDDVIIEWWKNFDDKGPYVPLVPSIKAKSDSDIPYNSTYNQKSVHYGVTFIMGPSIKKLIERQKQASRGRSLSQPEDRARLMRMSSQSDPSLNQSNRP